MRIGSYRNNPHLWPKKRVIRQVGETAVGRDKRQRAMNELAERHGVAMTSPPASRRFTKDEFLYGEVAQRGMVKVYQTTDPDRVRAHEACAGMFAQAAHDLTALEQFKAWLEVQLKDCADLAGAEDGDGLDAMHAAYDSALAQLKELGL